MIPEDSVPRCPICGEECSTIFRNVDGDIVGCDECIQLQDVVYVDECWEKA